MSWLELDDGILDHPRFIRAVKLGGSEAVHLWLGIKAYCSKHLTDGEIPADMLDEVRGPTDKRKHALALEALFTVGLLEKRPDGSVWMHDYLQWSSSRATVLDRREKARERKAKSRSPSRRDSTETDSDVTPGVTNPSSLSPPPPLPSTPLLVSAPGPRVAAADPEWDEREMPIPQGIAEKLIGMGVHVELAEGLRVDAESVAHELREFEAYWTIGGGTGQRRRHWARKAREWVRDQAKQNKLTPVGALQHAANPLRKAHIDAVCEQVLAEFGGET